MARFHVWPAHSVSFKSRASRLACGFMAGRLPIHDIEEQLVTGRRKTRRLIVCAPIGSGKSTQVPQILLDRGVLGAGQVVILQPRVFYDPGTKRVYAEEQLRFRDLAIGAHRVEPPPVDASARLLAEEVLAGRLKLNDWDEALEQWILRLNLLSRWCPELALPPIGEEDHRHLVEQICHGSFSGKDLKDKPVKTIVKSWLSGAQEGLLEKHAPERLSLSNGRTAKVIYEVGTPPHIALRIQLLYGVKTTPRIAMGRVPVLVHILAPSQRPVQIAQDMAGFWREHYHGIKQQLQRKYPRHEWR